MPARTDKRDTFALAAALTGMDIAFQDGVDGSAIAAQAIPNVKSPCMTVPLHELIN